MKLIERYIFRKLVSSSLLTFIALGAMVWLSQALGQFDLVTADGQGISTFLIVSALLVPVLIAIVFPIALLIAVIYTFMSMNGDSELVVINASGARQWTVLKPVLMIAVLATIAVGAMTLYFSPLALRSWEVLITNVRGNIITQFMQEGAFIQLTPKLTFHMRSRNQDGSLRGIFVSDDREPDKTITYIAEKGAILENPLGTFLIMANGTIQQRSKIDQSTSIIEFTSYAFDLSSFAASATTPTLKPVERPTTYLLNPDPDDPYFRDSPGKFRAELISRLSTPLYCFVFALLPLLFLGQAESTRRGRGPSATAAVLLVLIVRVGSLFLPVETSVIAQIATFAIPIGLSLLAALLILVGVQWRPPQALVAFGEGIYGRVSGLVGNRAAAGAR